MSLPDFEGLYKTKEEAQEAIDKKIDWLVTGAADGTLDQKSIALVELGSVRAGQEIFIPAKLLPHDVGPDYVSIQPEGSNLSIIVWRKNRHVYVRA